jgi:hypothetical protein
VLEGTQQATLSGSPLHMVEPIHLPSELKKHLRLFEYMRPRGARMKSEMFVMSLLLVIGAFIGIATAMESVNPFNVPDDFSEWPDVTAPTRIPGLNPFQVPEGFNAWPDVTAPTRIPGLNPFGHYDIVFPTPTDNQEYDPGVRWERPVRTDWINQTSIRSRLNSLTSVVDGQSLISSRLSQLL